MTNVDEEQLDHLAAFLIQGERLKSVNVSNSPHTSNFVEACNYFKLRPDSMIGIWNNRVAELHVPFAGGGTVSVGKQKPAVSRQSEDAVLRLNNVETIVKAVLLDLGTASFGRMTETSEQLWEMLGLSSEDRTNLGAIRAYLSTHLSMAEAIRNNYGSTAAQLASKANSIAEHYLVACKYFRVSAIDLRDRWYSEVASLGGIKAVDTRP